MLFPPNTTPLRLESRNVRVAFFDEASFSTKPHCQRGHVCMLHTSSPARCICAECRRPLSRLRPAFICDLCAAADWLCGECVTYGEGQDVLQGLSRISYQAELIAPMFQTPTQVNSPTNTELMNCASKLRRRVAPIQIRRAAFQEETEEGRRRLARASTADAGGGSAECGEPGGGGGGFASRRPEEPLLFQPFGYAQYPVGTADLIASRIPPGQSGITE